MSQIIIKRMLFATLAPAGVSPKFVNMYHLIRYISKLFPSNFLPFKSAVILYYFLILVQLNDLTPFPFSASKYIKSFVPLATFFLVTRNTETCEIMPDVKSDKVRKGEGNRFPFGKILSF